MGTSRTDPREEEEAYMLDGDDGDDEPACPNHRRPKRTRALDFIPTFGHSGGDRNDSRRLKTSTKRRQCLDSRLVRLVLYLPIAILASFGILHLIRSDWSGESVFFAPDGPAFLPDWGKPGQDGEFVAHYPTDATRDVIPVPCHSHNDYWRRIPLFEALHYGCTGVEADVWLKHEELYVGHSVPSLTRNRTFRAMYVNPLMELLATQNPSTEFANITGHGVFDEDPEQTLVLLVDFKTEGAETWPTVWEQLAPLRDGGYLSSWNGSVTTYRAITVVATGNAPFDLVVANKTYRDVFFDAPLDRLGADLEGGEAKGSNPFDSSNAYYASVSLKATIGNVKHGRFASSQLEMIRTHIKIAKDSGLKSRYWETPAWPVGVRNYVWRTLVDEGVEMLNVDNLKAAARMDWRKHEHGIV